MSKTKFMMLALAGSALAAVPAQAQLLGGAGDCLCQAVGGLLDGGAPGGRLLGNGSFVGNGTGSVTKTLDVTVTRSIDPRGGSASANAGIAGSVSSVANATVGANGLGKSIGLAGSSSSRGSAEKNAGLSVSGIGIDHAKSVAGNVGTSASAIVSKAHGAGQGGSSSLTGTLNAATSNALSVTKSHGGSGDTAGSSKSIAGTVNSASNAAVDLTKTHGGSGDPGSSSKSLTGSLNSAASGAQSLTKTGSPPAGGSGGGSAPGLGSLPNCLSLCEGGSGSGSSGGKERSDERRAPAATQGPMRPRRDPSRLRHDSDMADRKDLWWPQHTEGNYRQGRLKDH